MRRTCICILSKTGDHLRPLYCVGIPEKSDVHSLKIGMDENRFFAKLIVKVASYRVDQDNYQQVLNMLSPKAVDILLNKNFMVMSLFAGTKPIGVVYADARGNEEKISEQEYQAFKTICQSTSFALSSFAHKYNNKPRKKAS